MNKPLIHLVAAARPNFMKVAPLYHALKNEAWCETRIVHTGQHYDAEMSDAILQDLGLPDPHIHLGIGSGSHAEQTAGVMIAYEKVCLKDSPDWTVVVGDVNSTLVCTLAAKKLDIPVAHLEAGLRSGDRTMPEEINRIVTDALADVLWTPSSDANENLIREGVAKEKIQHVGNIMIDSYELLREKIETDRTWAKFDLKVGSYAVGTLHRPSNVDSEKALSMVVNALVQSSKRLKMIVPVHPRTKERLNQFGLMQNMDAASNIHLTRPLSYLPFMGLVHRANLVITDSGGIQEETTYLNIPCLTLRSTTERPITITQGTNRLVKSEDLDQEVKRVLREEWQQGIKPELWDGYTAGRVVVSLKERFEGSKLQL
ncbi:MAG: UDP-N-acetylglucosamine 2-epimerase (non-hydrolyzing) [Gammaproteobacteria bacterium]|nr:UDP-N-acetylglucosamine 2-epimerase (non-hydrolyzing) [Gammaproteobacteria bacterium]MDH3411600.1 UDP-N-acetylglucosamine 2-epimerase (non-hydrolyzing) [Gammaproteobacteria bacterium]